MHVHCAMERALHERTWQDDSLLFSGLSVASFSHPRSEAKRLHTLDNPPAMLGVI